MSLFSYYRSLNKLRRTTDKPRSENPNAMFNSYEIKDTCRKKHDLLKCLQNKNILIKIACMSLTFDNLFEDTMQHTSM